MKRRLHRFTECPECGYRMIYGFSCPDCNDRPTYTTRDCYDATPSDNKTDANEFDSFFTDFGGEGGDSSESS